MARHRPRELQEVLQVPSRGARALLAALLATGVTAGCGGDDPAVAPGPTPSVGQRIDETVEAELGGVRLRLEVADEPRERAVGLMGRSEVPAGTGMVFRFDEPVRSSFYMFQVPIPLTGVFLRDGVVVHVAQMEPCRESEASRCPLYGPQEPFDAVVETAPATLPDVRRGDRLAYR